MFTMLSISQTGTSLDLLWVVAPALAIGFWWFLIPAAVSLASGIAGQAMKQKGVEEEAAEQERKRGLALGELGMDQLASPMQGADLQTFGPPTPGGAVPGAAPQLPGLGMPTGSPSPGGGNPYDMGTGGMMKYGG